MKAVDTNILARYFVRDNEHQTRLVDQLLSSGRVFVSIAVCLELIWLLRSRYGFDYPRIVLCLSTLAELPTVTLEAGDLVEQALHKARSAKALADLLLVIAGRSCESFITFDADLAKNAGEGGPPLVELLA